MPQQLPTHPNLDHLKKQAKDVLRVFRRQKPRWKLSDAQRAIARGYGFVNWPSLKTHVEKMRHEQRPTLPTSSRAFEPDDSSILKMSLRYPEASPVNRTIHPIVGAWIVDRVMASTPRDSRPSNDDAVVEFLLNGEAIKLTQIATDATGHEIAITTTIFPDGQEHAIPFGQGARLKAVCTRSEEHTSELQSQSN